jgi:phage terminase large subunit
MTRPRLDVDIPEAFEGLFLPARYKVYWGGRGAAKSRSIARALVIKAYSTPTRILCTREYQNSITDSVHRLLSDEISRFKLDRHFKITERSIKSWCGSEFIFKGLHHNVDDIKSTEGVDICWVEEAQRVTAASWQTLIPTIRGDQSEIWVSFNPEQEEDATPSLFLKNPPPRSIIRKVGWQDNPWFPKVLDEERRHMQATDPDAYDHVWEGNFRKVTEAVIFRGKYSVESFETPREVDRFFCGADWGFSNDPTAIVRCFIKENTLFIDHESFGHGIDFPELPQLFDRIPDIRNWPIKSDCSRPETISYMARMGFNISAAEKWSGSVEDGISHLRGFDKIIIHERCVNLCREARLYSYKVDKRQVDDKGQPLVLPVIVDAHNHGWDAIRYALDGYIRKRGASGIWERLLDD